MAGFVAAGSLWVSSAPGVALSSRWVSGRCMRKGKAASVCAMASTIGRPQAGDEQSGVWEASDAHLEKLSHQLESGVEVPMSDVQKVVEQYQDSRGMTRLSLVQAVAQVDKAQPHQHESIASIFLAGLRESPNPVVRRSCAKTLAYISAANATPDLIRTLVDDDDQVTRSSAAGALAKVGPGAVPALLHLIRSEDTSSTARGHAIWAIEHMGKSATEVLLREVDCGDPIVQSVAVRALTAIAVMDEEEEDSSDDGVSRAAIAQLVQTRLQQSIEADDLAVEIVAAAGDLRLGSATADILELLDSEGDPELHRACCLALMKIGDDRVIDRLLECSKDESRPEAVRNAAKLACSQLYVEAESQ